jgi:hypothetical protein
VPEPDLVLLGHRLADDPEGLGGELAVGMHPIGGIEIDRIDLVTIDKAVEVDDLRRFDLQVFQLVVADRDIAPALVLVALDDLIAVDDLAGLGVDELLRHTIAGLAVQLVEPDALGLGRRRHQVDRAGHQRQAQEPVPASSGHLDLLFRLKTGESLTNPYRRSFPAATAVINSPFAAAPRH